MDSIYTSIKECICCKNKNLNCILDLGYQPLANDFHKNNINSDKYPLKLMNCNNCFHSQLSHAVNPEILFKAYKYVSGTSETGHFFFQKNAEFIHTLNNCISGKILDIACNDGTQLDYFKNLGWETYGVDPAENLCPIAEEKGHKVICRFWDDICVKQLPIMDVITAQNVFAHTATASDSFLINCKSIMNKNSSLYIQTSQRDMIVNGEFDTIYHEHISFFNTKSMKKLVERCGLVLNRVLENEIHGRSYIFEIKLEKNNQYNVDEIMNVEEKVGLYSPIIYEKFNLNADRCVNKLRYTIEKYRKTHKCIGFGAAAKGQTVICYGNIDLEYIIDENLLKIGHLSPKLDIPIVDIEHFINDNSTDKFLIVILAWNFSKEIIQKIENIKGGKNIIIIEKYFPEINIINLI
jgi:2-polyprenyl-3-methyl-5-hydroxy-6-metoxy-1,4-benzoquinol methylase